jgi:hypothetical protein
VLLNISTKSVIVTHIIDSFPNEPAGRNGVYYDLIAVAVNYLQSRLEVINLFKPDAGVPSSTLYNLDLTNDQTLVKRLDCITYSISIPQKY